MSGPVLSFPFKVGIDEGADPKNLPPGTLLVAENVRMDKIGRLRKRKGTTGITRAIGSGGSISAATRLVTDGNVLGLSDGTNLYQYSATLNQWRTVDRVPNLKATWKPLIDTARGACDVTTAVYNDNVVVFAFSDNGGQAGHGNIYVEARDLSTGDTVLPRTKISTGSFPRLFIRGTAAVVVFADAPFGFSAVEVDIPTGVVGPTRLLIGNGAGATNAPFDAQLIGNTLYTTVSIVAGGNTTVQADAWDASAAYANLATRNVNVIAGVTHPCHSIAINVTLGESFYVLFSQEDAAQTRIAVLDPATLNVVTAATAVSDPSGDTYLAGVETLAITRFDATHALIAVSNSTPAGSFGPRTSTWVISNAAANSANTQRASFWCTLLGGFWTTAGRTYLCVADQALAFDSLPVPPSTNSVIEIETSSLTTRNAGHRVAAVLDVNFAGRNTTLFGAAGGITGLVKGTYTAQSPTTSAGKAVLAVPYVDKPRTYIQELVSNGYDLVLLETPGSTDDFARPVPVDSNRIFTPGGAPQWIDGYVNSHTGFLHPPHVVAISTAGVGGNMAAGTYQYVLVYEYLDARGVLHRSAPSVPKSITTVGATSTVSLTMALSGDSDRLLLPVLGGIAMGAPRIAIYRTEANGTIFYRLSHDPDLNQALDVGGASQMVVTDTSADANIGVSGGVTIHLNTQPQPYTTGGVLEDDPATACITATLHQRRVVTLDGDQRTVRFTQDMSENPLIAPGFNEVLTLTFDRDKTSLVSLDEKLVVLGPDSIDVVEGEGLTNSGTGSGWTTRRIQSDVGCVNARSVAIVPLGALFLSRRGLELCDRGLNVTWVGRQVQDELTAYPVVTSAVTVAADHEVRWTCNKSDGSAGIVIVYDYTNNVWSTRKYYDSVTTNASTPFVDAALVGGVYTLLTAQGKVYQENPSTGEGASFLDDGTQWVTLHLETAPISPGGNLSWHSIKQFALLGSSLTHHDLVVKVGKDFRTDWEQTHHFIAGSDVTGAPSTLETVRVTHKVMKVQAARYYIADAAPSNALAVTTGEGPMLEGFGIITRAKSGFPPRSASREA